MVHPDADIVLPRYEVAEYAAGLLDAALLLENLGLPLAAELHRLAARLEWELFGDLPETEEEADE
jgi:hypothetical protein